MFVSEFPFRVPSFQGLITMKQLSEYFAEALKAEIARHPRGFRNRLAESTGVQASQITDIISGRAYGSEERRRLLANTLGWEYEEFLRYGECLSKGQKYVRSTPPITAPDASSYFMVPFHKNITKIGHPGGNIYIPDRTESNPPLLLNKLYLETHVKSDSLVAFKMLDDSMEPTIDKNRIVIVDTSDKMQKHGHIYLLSIKTETSQYCIKRVQLHTDEVYLISDNPSKSATLLRQQWDEIVVGCVVWKWLEPV